MEISLKNYKVILPKELIKKAEQNTVRECDEIEKGQFQAYVDENEQTYDVFITLNNKGLVVAHGCDCVAAVDFCRHKTALLLFLGKDKTIATTVKSRKKVSQLEVLLNEVDPQSLKTWVYELLIKNKNFEMAFILKFSGKHKQYTPAEVKKLMLDVVKAVLKNRIKADSNEAKKIVELWTEISNPIVKQYVLQVEDESSFLNFHALMEACEDVQFKVYTSSNRLGKYVENLLLHLIPTLNQLKDEDYWDIATGYFADRIRGELYHLRIYYMNFLSALISASSMERRKRLTIKLLKYYVTVKPDEFNNGNEYIFFIYDSVNNSELFAEHYQLFKPVYYQNEYNLSLIESLKAHGHISLAEQYCLQQIEYNSKDAYNVPYLEILKSIYTKARDHDKLAGVLKGLFSETYDFDDFLFIYSHLEGEEEKKKWRTKIMARARQMAAYHPKAMLFSFKLLDYEQNYRKMLDYFDSYTPLDVFIQYVPKIALKDREGLLRHLVNRSDSHLNSYDVNWLEKEEASFSRLLEVLLVHYPAYELKLVVQQEEKKKRNWSHSSNRFITFMSNNLS